MPNIQTVFKIIPIAQWQEVIALGEVPYSALDKADGFMHLSTIDQYMDTVNLHYTEFKEVLALEIAIDDMEGEIKWEPAKKRNNSLFPHLYGRVPNAAICAVHKLIQKSDNTFQNTGVVPPDGALA